MLRRGAVALAALMAMATAAAPPVAAEAPVEGAEIVSERTFGHGAMVVRATFPEGSGFVSNIFFYNREDVPWEGNEWFEYDWELKGRNPDGGWSQLRVRKAPNKGLRDVPDEVETKRSIAERTLHYILIRHEHTYVYDIRWGFNPATYDHTNPKAHRGNTRSLIVGGARVVNTDTDPRIGNIPLGKKLDFNLGITAFDNAWAGYLAPGPVDEVFKVDYARFYDTTRKGKRITLANEPEWREEFNARNADLPGWRKGFWPTGATVFRPDNVKVRDGWLHLELDRP
ncbi:MAG: hypothetical protein AAGD35_01930 [Actinomycetota bacterium]